MQTNGSVEILLISLITLDTHHFTEIRLIQVISFHFIVVKKRKKSHIPKIVYKCKSYWKLYYLVNIKSWKQNPKCVFYIAMLPAHNRYSMWFNCF